MTGMAVDRDLADMMNTVFAGHSPGSFTASATWDDALWAKLGELGLTRLTGEESGGGSGAGWPEAAALLSAAASHAVRVPLAEHDLLAGWLLAQAGLPAGDQRRTVCVLDEGGRATAVPWTSSAERIVAVWPVAGAYRVADVEPGRFEITPGRNLAGEPRDDVRADVSALDGIPVGAGVIESLNLRAALARGIALCAVLDRIVELSVKHVTERHQFGRPLAKFQAVQHEIADMAAEAALARAATEAALAEAVRTDWSSPALTFRIAAARSCAGHAASVLVRNAHQVHGAIGTTLEHELHQFTLLALAWRSEYGSVRHWDGVVAAAAAEAGADGLWSLIV
jgi:acyl-CoA dehydrogenase